jgi:hypothetical protein
MIENKGAKRVFFLTDTHLGVRNSSNEWIEIIGAYFNEWFIPMVKENYRPGDVLVHLGDVYDSRQSINLKVLNLGVDVFEKLSEIFKDGIYVIAGNHDLWGKNSNDINSLKSIKWIPGVTIFEEPETLILGDKKFFMMPWRKDHEAEEDTLEKTKAHDYLCCHADIRGLKFNKFVEVDHGADIKKFKKFTSVYSGHIHYAQRVKNINMLGSPYQLTRSDMENSKGITLLDLETGKETFFENNFSPKFKKFFFNQILDMTPSEVESAFSNNFVDVMIDPKMALTAPLNILTDLVTSQRKISFHPHDPDQVNGLSSVIYSTEGKNFDVMDFVKEYVSGLEYDKDTKNRLVGSIEKLYKITLDREQGGIK